MRAPRGGKGREDPGNKGDPGVSVLPVRPHLAALAALAALSSTSAAGADDTFTPTRSPALVERAHRVELTLRGDHAHLRVEREVFNGGPRPDQAVFLLSPPPGGVATRLRTQALVEGRPTWFEGELMEAEAAAAKYRELTGIGGFYPKDPALLSWRHQSRLALQVFPCMPAQTKKVDYELLVPMQYEQGRWSIRMPRLGTRAVPAVATIRVAEGLGTAHVDGRPSSPFVPVTLDAEHLVELLPRFPDPIDGAVASVHVEGDRHAATMHLEAAPRLSTVPDRASVVVLVDASRSVPAADRAASLAAGRAYLSHFAGRDARVAAVSFARSTRDLTTGFVGVDGASSALDPARITEENGSELGVALARARALLESTPPGRARRVLVLSDRATREGLDPATLQRVLGTDVVTHFGAVRAGHAPSLTRDDGDPWSVVARRTGGVVWDARADVETDGVRARRRTFEEWARPVRIDHVAIDAPGITQPFGESIAEGEGVSFEGFTGRAVPFASLQGELWSTPVRRTLTPDAAGEKRWAAMIFGTPLMHDLTEPQMMKLAMHGGAVSPVTSYLAIEPGVRPSTEGLEPNEGSTSASGVGFGSGGGRMFGAAGRHVIDHARWLRDALDPAVRACGILDGDVSVSVETTWDEIVDVGVEAPAADAGKRTCLAERAWALTLPASFDFASRTFTVTL